MWMVIAMIKLDDQQLSRPFIVPLCRVCIHLKTVEGLSCKAFPSGIPKDVLSGDFVHTKTHPNQVGSTLFMNIGKEDE